MKDNLLMLGLKEVMRLRKKQKKNMRNSKEKKIGFMKI
jgi:hypothetical protein